MQAALSGTVVGSGNMDTAGGGRCRAYGKWVMIKHANGLSTLYAHLSLIAVTTGQELLTGQVLGYSGNTGATTGPHLHFEVLPLSPNFQNGFAGRIDPAPFL